MKKIHGNTIDFSWNSIPDDDDKYEIYRDQKLYAVVKGTFLQTLM
jgi:hypothetical protein